MQYNYVTYIITVKLLLFYSQNVLTWITAM
jgi:hypothetical protein